MPKWFNIDKFLGIYTRAGRSDRPVGALSDCQNLVLNDQMNKLTLRSGYASDIAANPTSIEGTVMTTVNQYFCLPVTNPTPQNIELLLGTDGSSNKWIFQRPWWDYAGTLQNTWREFADLNTPTVVSSVSNPTMVLNSGVATDNYYNGWPIYNVTRSSWGFVSGYVGSTKTATCSFFPDGTVNTDTIRLYRDFAWNNTFVPSYNAMPTNTPAAAVSLGNAVAVSGGQGSTVGLKPIWSGYLNKTFFPSTTPIVVTGTYVTEAEITTGSVDGGIGQNTGGLYFYNLAMSTATGNGLAQYTWFLAYVLETDDGQKSAPIKTATNYITVNAADNGLSLILNVQAAFNKRIKYIHAFLGYTTNSAATTLDWSQYFLIRTVDLTATTAAGNPFIKGATSFWTAATAYDVRDWNLRGTDLVSFLGTTSYTSATCSFSFAKMVANRLIVGKIYDYVSSLSLDDTIRFSGFGNGAAQYNVLTDNPIYGQAKIVQDAGSAIMGLDNFQNTLVVFKTKSMYSIVVTSDATSWELVTISATIGTDAPKSIVNIGSGVIFAKSGDDVFVWSGGNPQGLTDQWQKTYRSYLTTPNAWYGIFNPTTKTYYLTCDKSDATIVHGICFNQPIDNDRFSWIKHKYAHNATILSTRPNGDVLLSNGTVIYKFSDTATDDAGTAIAPYFDTGDYVLDENQLTQLVGWFLNQTYSGSPAGTLDAKIYVNGVSVGTFTGLTKTLTRYNKLLPIATTPGTRIRLEFNTNATKATMGTAYSVEAVGFNYNLLPYVGDATVQ